MRILSRRLTVLFLFLTLPELTFGWGDNAHKQINLVALKKTPSDMPAFLKEATLRIEYLAPEPDRWKRPSEAELRSAKRPDHFIDFEIAGGIELPRYRYRIIEILVKNGLPADTLGFLPWTIVEVQQQLTSAFRQYLQIKHEEPKYEEAVKENCIYYAGLLSHFVADGSMPLHTTINYNGWLGKNNRGYTQKKGIHGLFEVTFVDSCYIKPDDFENYVEKPVRYRDVFEATIDYLRESFKLVPNVYELEKDGKLINCNNEAREFVLRRMAVGSQMLLNLWYTSWMDAKEQYEKEHK